MVGLDPPDAQSLRYLEQTGRSREVVELFRAYYEAQGLLRMPRPGEVDYSEVIELDLSTVRPAVAGPKRPQDRIPLEALGATFRELLARSDATGYGKDPAELGRRFPWTSGLDGRGRPGGGLQDPETAPEGRTRSTSTLSETEMMNNRPTPDGQAAPASSRLRDEDVEVGHGDVLIAACLVWLTGGTESILLATGILGATVMPHVIFLHSGLTQGRIVTRDPAQLRRLFRFELVDVAVAMGLAGLVNGAMLIMAASTFHTAGATSVGSLEEAYQTLVNSIGDARNAWKLPDRSLGHGTRPNSVFRFDCRSRRYAGAKTPSPSIHRSRQRSSLRAISRACCSWVSSLIAFSRAM